ncbi:hypothetical protein ASD35_22940 [Pelomonas sp. Root1444]|nr:hypothetical protein ASD35_22940 [Pelomonas sp. Root1444]
MNSTWQAATVFDLQTGEMSRLPVSGLKAPGSGEGDEWQATTMSPRLLRFNDIQLATDPGPNARIAVFDSATSTTARHEWRVEGRVETQPLVSPDGTKALAFYRSSGSENPRLSILNLVTGTLVKQGSLLDGETILDNPVTWLPDGRYAYLVENRLIVSSPDSNTETEVARFTALPSNRTSNWTGYVSGQSSLVASPDGKRVAFSWVEKRGNGFDKHVWVAGVDGTGLRRLTKVPDETDPLTFRFVSPGWSPDGQWVVAHLDMSATQTAPVFPPSPYDDIPPPQTVSGTTGCGNSQIVIFSVGADREAISWPTLDATHGVRVKEADGKAAWLTSCSPVSWLP